MNKKDVELKVDAKGDRYNFRDESDKNPFLEGSKIAYFSMEIGIRSDIPTYSGGLGVLAGDTIRSAADLNIPLVAVTLVSRKGYVKQKIDKDGQQHDFPDEWYPSKYARILPDTITLRLEGNDVKVAAWLYEHKSPIGSKIPIIFLDTDVEGNTPDDRHITDYLYGGDKKYRLKQEAVLGIGGIKMLDTLKYPIKKYHMNEGHSSLLTLEVLKKYNMGINRTREVCIFTTHTPVSAAFDIFPYDLVSQVISDYADIRFLQDYAGHDGLNMTLLALNLSKYVNGVANTHMAISRKLFPGYFIRAITNGVYSGLWTSIHFKNLFDKYIQGWTNEPELLVRAAAIPLEEIMNAHIESKKDTLNYIKDLTGIVMDVNTLTIGFARRATAYKRATLIFSDINRLREINKAGNIQLVFAGKAHPNDEIGKKMIKEIVGYSKQLKDELKIVYLEDYNMDMAAKLTSGVDIWLGTPMIQLEASGTSGMKAAHNGVINFSILDGWWAEGCVEGVNGWSIGPPPNEYISAEKRIEREIKDLYNKLEYVIIPMYYMNMDRWLQVMRNSISMLAYYFNTNRMMRRYITEAYF